ncbi:hypothetical protein QR680_001556 [Steinernema hermaphroditum]|uniref:Uncharacterized protein n=1 Tax=Steinernema hermaphroditum TaxID=289476 RepID=A0AA39GYV4_9BILA|nr:hypothetical protein QR680_001556 [Steinernema hermaphroditum]
MATVFPLLILVYLMHGTRAAGQLVNVTYTDCYTTLIIETHHHKYAHDDGLHDHVYNYSINDKQYYYHKRYNDNDNHNYNYNHNHHVRRQYDNNGKQFDDIELYGIYNH